MTNINNNGNNTNKMSTSTNKSASNVQSGGGSSNSTNTSNKSNGGMFKQTFTLVGSYSSAKLAPPLMGASVEDHERRGTFQDQKIWYTVQIFPCPITFPPRPGTTESEPLAPIPRKSYSVFRKFEDMMDFAVRLEDEFPWLKSSQDTAMKTVCV
jgi:hypothetical protein